MTEMPSDPSNHDEPAAQAPAAAPKQAESNNDPERSGLSTDTPGDPLPALNFIPLQLIEAFLAIPSDEYVDFRLTRTDIDRLYGAINNGIEAQWTFQNAMIDQTNGRTNEANQNLRKAQARLIHASNDLRALMTAVMASVIGRREPT
jgi:uncharacterized coiled-coil protein SlyX